MDATGRTVLRRGPRWGAPRPRAVATALVVLLGTALLGGTALQEPATVPGTAWEPRGTGPAVAPTAGPFGDGPGPAVPLPAAPGATYTWPLAPAPPVVLRPFQEPTHRFGPGHRGVDLAAPGAAVLAAGAGVVVFAGVLAGRGVVSVQHADGLRTTYEPVVPAVVAGATVARGAVLGAPAAGHAGCPVTCLHWGARRDRTTYVDPLLLVAPPHVRLLPVPEPARPVRTAVSAPWPPVPGTERGPPSAVGGLLESPAPRPAAGPPTRSRSGSVSISWSGAVARSRTDGAVTPGDEPARGPPSTARR